MSPFQIVTLRVALSLITLLVPLAAVYAQGVGSSRGLPGGSGRHIIKGRVFTPSGSPYPSLKVRLEGDIIDSSTTVTDSNGAFMFNGLPAGDYVVVVDAGKNLELAREPVTIYGANANESVNSQQSINLPPIRLREKVSAGSSGKVLYTALATAPKQAVDLFYKAREFAVKGEHQKAVDQLKAALAIHPGFPLALSELGVQYMRLGQADKAAVAFAAALKLDPEEVALRLNYGIALLNLKKFGEAEKELREVLKQNDALSTAHMYLGIALISQKRLDEAEQELLKAVASNNPEVASAHRYLGGIYWGRRNYEKAAHALETYLKLAPNAPDAEKVRVTIRELRAKG